MRYELRPKVAHRRRSCKLPPAHERSLTISSTTQAYLAGLLGTITFRLRLMLDSGVLHTLYRTEALDMKRLFPRMPHRSRPPWKAC